MLKHYRITDPLDVRDLADQIAAWTAAGNPKANDWAEQPAAPSADAVWTADAEWVVPAAPTFTAEAWLEAQGYGGSRPTLLLYRKMQLDALGLQSLKLTAAQFWMDNLLAAVSLNPDELRSDWQPAPYPFAQVTAECQQLLTPPTEPPASD